MTTDQEKSLISTHMFEYAKLIQAEAEKMELLGIQTVPNLFDKAQEIHYLAELIGLKEKLLHSV